MPGMLRLPDSFLFRFQIATLENKWLSRFGSEVLFLFSKGDAQRVMIEAPHTPPPRCKKGDGPGKAPHPPPRCEGNALNLTPGTYFLKETSMKLAVLNDVVYGYASAADWPSVAQSDINGCG